MKALVRKTVVGTGVLFGLSYLKNSYHTYNVLTTKYKDISFSSFQGESAGPPTVYIKPTCKFLNSFIDDMKKIGAYHDPVVFKKERSNLKEKFVTHALRNFPPTSCRFDRDSVRWVERYETASPLVKYSLRDNYTKVLQLMLKNEYYYCNLDYLGRGLRMINEDFDDPEIITGRQVLARPPFFSRINGLRAKLNMTFVIMLKFHLAYKN